MRTVIPSNPADEPRVLLEVTALANRCAGRLTDPDDADDLARLAARVRPTSPRRTAPASAPGDPPPAR